MSSAGLIGVRTLRATRTVSAGIDVLAQLSNWQKSRSPEPLSNGSILQSEEVCYRFLRDRSLDLDSMDLDKRLGRPVYRHGSRWSVSAVEQKVKQRVNT